MDINQINEILNFEEYDYFYHETEDGVGEQIMEEGLLIQSEDKVKFYNLNKLIFNTAIPLTQDIVSNQNVFTSFLETEISHSKIRPVTEMVIVAFPKKTDERSYDFVEAYNDYGNDGNFYAGIVRPQNILGVIKLEDKSIAVNPECNCFPVGFDPSEYSSPRGL